MKAQTESVNMASRIAESPKAFRGISNFLHIILQKTEDLVFFLWTSSLFTTMVVETKKNNTNNTI